MSSFRPIARVGAALAVGSLAIGLSALPAGSQEQDWPLTIIGEANCAVIAGTPVLNVYYEIDNVAESEVDIIEAAVGLSETENFLDNVFFDPNPIPGGETASGAVVLPGDIVGHLVLQVEWISEGLEDSGFEQYELEIEAPCEAPPTTTSTSTTSTTAASGAANAAVVRPTFTG